MAEQILQIENVDPKELHGPNDKYLELVKSMFPKLKIIARGDFVKVIGDDEEIEYRQTNYIKNHVNKFDQALKSDNFDDPTKGYRAYVDSLSLIDWYICTEVSANIDGFYSTYFYKERGDDRLFDRFFDRR